jgi:hypothetical protein
MHNAQYTREELIRVVCAIAGRAVYTPGAWASAPNVVAEAVGILEEVDRVWGVNAPEPAHSAATPSPDSD